MASASSGRAWGRIYGAGERAHVIIARRSRRKEMRRVGPPPTWPCYCTARDARVYVALLLHGTRCSRLCSAPPRISELRPPPRTLRPRRSVQRHPRPAVPSLRLSGGLPAPPSATVTPRWGGQSWQRCAPSVPLPSPVRRPAGVGVRAPRAGVGVWPSIPERNANVCARMLLGVHGSYGCGVQW